MLGGTAQTESDSFVVSAVVCTARPPDFGVVWTSIMISFAGQVWFLGYIELLNLFLLFFFSLIKDGFCFFLKELAYVFCG